MKYGRHDIEKKQRNMTAEKVEQKAGMTLLRLLLVALFALVIAGVCAGYGMMQGLLKSAAECEDPFGTFISVCGRAGLCVSGCYAKR